MRFVNVAGLKRIGEGAFSIVYRLSKDKIIKVYEFKYQHEANIMAEEIELSMHSEHTLAVLETAVARRGKRYYYAVIKKYIPFETNWHEVSRLSAKLPSKLRHDCCTSNARKDRDGKVLLVDTQGKYAFRALLGNNWRGY